MKNSDFMKVLLHVVRSQFCWAQCTQIKKLLDTFTATGSSIPYSPKVRCFLNYMHVHNQSAHASLLPLKISFQVATYQNLTL